VQQVPPEFAQHIDPRDNIQMLLLQRIDKLTPQDIAACNSIPPAAVAALKKVIPEVGFLLDMIGKQPLQGGAQPSQNLPPQPTTNGPPQASAAPRPATRLGSY
jgi:hypothetical protein